MHRTKIGMAKLLQWGTEDKCPIFKAVLDLGKCDSFFDTLLNLVICGISRTRNKMWSHHWNVYLHSADQCIKHQDFKGKKKMPQNWSPNSPAHVWEGRAGYKQKGNPVMLR